MNPTVTAVMLTSDRHQLARKAVESFLKQSYENKALLIYDTGVEPLTVDVGTNIAYIAAPERGVPIGALRNNANRMVGADIIVHWDDDDWSHPERISEQVAMLQGSGAECVGYNEMLFWRCIESSRTEGAEGDWQYHERSVESSAWLYSNTARSDYAIGTSLCYWRKTWEAKQFRDDLPNPDSAGEDNKWIQEMKLCATTAFGKNDKFPGSTNLTPAAEILDPRMIARIHGGNTRMKRDYQIEATVANGSREWKRRPDWDERVREVLA